MIMFNPHITNEYANDYSKQDFWQKITNHAKKIGEELVEKTLCLYFVAQEENVPIKAKMTIYGALGYLISPIDGISDVVPAIGYSDDLAVVALAVVQLAIYITPEIKQRARAVMHNWFN